MKWFGREPAWFLAILAAIIQVAVAFGFDLNDLQQAAINGAATALAGFAIAWAVSREKAVAALSGVASAAAQFAVAFGLSVTQEQITTVSVLLTLLMAGYVRPKVDAPVDADGTDRRELHAA
jgi:hypothetical protein